MSLSNFPNNTCKRDCLFSTVYSCLLCQRLIDLGVWVHFWVLFSVPFMYMSFFVPISHCFDYCRLVELSEVWEGYASYTVLFPQDCFGYSGSSIQFSSSVMSDSLRPHRLQHSRLPCPSSTPRAYSNSCPLSRYCHPTILSSVVAFSHLQFFPASGSFQMSQFSTSGGQSVGVSASASVLPMFSGLISFRMD